MMINLKNVNAAIRSAYYLQIEIEAPRSQVLLKEKAINISQLRNSVKSKMSINTQTTLSKKLGITQAYLSMILSGKRTPKKANLILKKLNSYLHPKYSKK